MKKSQLRQIIREEIRNLISEITPPKYKKGQRVVVYSPSPDHVKYGVKKGAKGIVTGKERWADIQGYEWAYKVKLNNGYEDMFYWDELEKW